MSLSVAEEKINVVILYDKHDAGLQAMALHAQLTRDLAGECVPELNLWRFDMATSPDAAPAIRRDLADADLVLVAIHGHQPCPEMFSRAPESAEPFDAAPHRVLIVLLELDGESAPTAGAWVELLRPIAAVRHATFLTWSPQASECGAAGVMREIGSNSLAEPELAGAVAGGN